LRKYTVLTALALTFSLIISTQLVTTQVRANGIRADVNIDPDSLLLKEGGNGNWITAYIGLPEGYDVENINVSTVTLNVMGKNVTVSKSDIQENKLMVKFDRVTVVSQIREQLPMMIHLTPHVKEEVTLEVTGKLTDDTTTFQGSDTIRVFFTQL